MSVIVNTCDLKIDNLTSEALKVIKKLNIPIHNNIMINSDYEYKMYYNKPMNLSLLGICFQKYNSFSIYIRSGLSDKNTFETILHELIHTCKGCFNHYNLFKHYSSIVNTYVKNNYSYKDFSCGYHEVNMDESEFTSNKYKYIVTCPNCNKKSYYSRKSKTLNNIIFSYNLKIESNYQCCNCGCSRLIPETINA